MVKTYTMDVRIAMLKKGGLLWQEITEIMIM